MKPVGSSSLYLLFGLGLLLSACVSSKPATFGIYLLRQDTSTADFQTTDLRKVELKEDPLISTDDVVSYAKATHEIELTPAVAQRVRDLYKNAVGVFGLPFVVCAGEARIYGGAFWTPVSSVSYNGVIILQSFDANDNVIRLSLGYPSAQAFTGKDPRADERIFKALEESGKLDGSSVK